MAWLVAKYPELLEELAGKLTLQWYHGLLCSHLLRNTLKFTNVMDQNPQVCHPELQGQVHTQRMTCLPHTGFIVTTGKQFTEGESLMDLCRHEVTVNGKGGMLSMQGKQL